jgi:hypothetical protein
MFGGVEEVVSAYDEHMNPPAPVLEKLRRHVANQVFARRKAELRARR